jgi:ATP synthase protein I
MPDDRDAPDELTPEVSNDAVQPAPDTNEPDQEARDRADELRKIVLHKSVRRARARRSESANIWSFMGMFGLVGWTVAIPTLLGLALGVFLDGRIDSSVSFTITFLVVGVAIGISMAWYWIRRESEGERRP